MKLCSYTGNYRGILEKKLGRKLTKGEEAHHINGCCKDDRPENLVAVVRKDHQALHRGPKPKSRICPVCGCKKYGTSFVHVRIRKQLANRLRAIASLNHRRGIQTDLNLAISEYIRRYEVLTNKRDNGK